MFLFSTNGYYALIGYGRNAKNAKRDIPKMLLLTTLTLIVCYCGPAMAAAACMTLEEYGDSTTLVFAARKIFPPVLYVVFIIGGPIMALLSTLNTSFANYGINMGQQCSDGWLPPVLGKKNKYGVAYIALTIQWVAVTLPVIFQFSITTLTNLVQLAASFYAFLNFFGFMKMPKLYPHAWKESSLHVPNGVYYGFCCASLIVAVISVWKTLLSMPTWLAVANVVMIGGFSLLSVIRSKTGTINIRTSVWSGNAEDDARVEEINRELARKCS